MYASPVNSVRGQPENTLHQEVMRQNGEDWESISISSMRQEHYCIHHAANWIQTLAVIDCNMRQADMQ